MKKLLKFLLILTVIVVILSFLSIRFSDIFGEWMRKAGMTDEQIGKVDDAYDQAMDKVQQGVQYVGNELNVMTDRLAEVVAGSEEAYQMVAKLYGNTRMEGYYVNLDEKVSQGKALCSIRNLVGSRNQPYQTGVNPFADGSDLWYAYGRFWEDNNIAPGGLGGGDPLTGVDDWVRQLYFQNHPEAKPSLYAPTDGYVGAAVFVIWEERKIYPHSIAVCGDSLIYIEDVRYENGVAATVYYSVAADQGVLHSTSGEEFFDTYEINGYISPLNIFI